MRVLGLGVLVLCTPLLLGDEKAEKQDAPPTLSKEEQAILDLTNKEREKEKLPPLRVNAKLLQSARAHSANMAKQNKMDHVLDGKEPKDRVKEIGYEYMHMGENVAYGQRTAADVLKVWMNSPGHRMNILRKEFTEIGIGVERSSKGVPYYAQVFGTPLSR
jgi:uncharacterized protein YkwD